MPGQRHPSGPEPPRRRVMLAAVWIEHQHRWGIARYARRARWIFDTATPASIDRLRAWKGDGVICQLHRSEAAFVRAVRRLRVPKVELSDHVPSMRLPRVMPDYEGCGRSIAQHFLERGFRHFAYYHEKPFRARWFDGFRARLGEEGAEATELLWDAPAARRAGYRDGEPRRWLADRLASLPKPLAVMTPGFDLAVEVMDSCERAGLLVADHVAVASVTEDEGLGELAPIPLTTISPNYEGQALCAAELIERMMEGERVAPETVRVPPTHLVVRQSSDITAVRHADVARAVTYVRRHMGDRDLWVPEVVRATAVSRRSLEQAFQEHLGRSIASEIRRLRLERAMDLMRSTDMTAAAIAGSCGYADAKQLRRALKRAVGTTPREYRRMHARDGA